MQGFSMIENPQPSGECPTRESLAGWLLNPDTVEKARAIESHVDSCPSCQKTLDELTSHSDLARKLEKGKALDYSADLKAVMKIFESSTTREGESVLKEGDSLGGYKITRTLGKGGMGRVYEAFDPKLQRLVAIKTIRYATGAENGVAARAYQKILSEARKLAGLKHDNLGGVLGVVEPTDSRPGCLVLELLTGLTLSDKLAAERRLGPTEAATILWQVALGIAAAHNQKILHCDLKPSNIILDTTTNRARVIDFGLARNMASGHDCIPFPNAGTIQYMAPEQVQGHTTLTPAVDIFALGVTLFECLTGERPFRGSLQAVMKQIVSEAPIAPRTLVDSIPPALEIICLKALAKNPADRYSTARALATDLDLFLQGRPILARPASKWEILVHWAKRNPRLASVSSALVFALVLLASVSTFTAFWQIEENRQSRVEKKRAERHLFLMLDNIRVNLQALQEEMQIRPGLDTLRDRIISRIEADLDSLVSQNETEPEVTRLKIKITHQVADIFAQSGRPEKARFHFTRIVADAEALRQADADDFAILRFQAWALVRLASLDASSGHLQNAHARLDSAAVLYSQLLTLGNDPSSAHWGLLMVEKDRAGLFHLERKYENALATLTRALGTLEKITLRDEEKFAELRNIHHQKGNCFLALGDREKAGVELNLALDYASKLAPFFSSRPEFKQNEMDTRDALAQLSLRFDKPEQYLAILEKNLAEALPWSLAAPDRTDRVLMLMQAQAHLGEGLLAAGQFDRASRHLQETLHMLEAHRAKDPGNLSLVQKEFHLLKSAQDCQTRLGNFNQALAAAVSRQKILPQLQSALTNVAFETLTKQVEQEIQVCQALDKQAAGQPLPPDMGQPVKTLAELWEIKKLAEKKEFPAAHARLKSLLLPTEVPYNLDFALACANAMMAHPESPFKEESSRLAAFHLGNALRKYPDYRKNFFSNPDFIFIRNTKFWNELR